MKGATAALQQRLEPLLPGLRVEVVAEVTSTNTELIERARQSNSTQPCLLVAEHQTQGRGRQGRAWQSAPGASLTFSLALKLAPADWSGLSLAVGVALANALDPLDSPDSLDPQRAGAAHRIGLKWPNDLWLTPGNGTGRKLGGVLIETLQVGEQRLCVAGVGLNVLPQAWQGLASGYGCLQEIDPAANAPAALAAVAEPLLRALLRFEREGFAAFDAAYARRDLLRGQAVTTTLPGVPAGVADGVDARGALRLHAAGQLHLLVGGEVSVRPGTPASAAPC